MIAGSRLPDSEAQQDKPTTSRVNSADGYLFMVLARLGAAIMNRVPFGYEDEMGFHVGKEYASTNNG